MDYLSIDDCVRFHGHLCGGVTLGYVMAKFAMEQISAGKEDALYCICEFQNCMTDAVQMVTGCTAGKGNLAVRPIGKRALTLIRKDTGKGVRVTAEFQFPSDVPKSESAMSVFEQAPETFCRAEEVTIPVPQKAASEYGYCPVCNEEYNTRVGVKVGETLMCPDCAARTQGDRR